MTSKKGGKKKAAKKKVAKRKRRPTLGGPAGATVIGPTAAVPPKPLEEGEEDADPGDTIFGGPHLTDRDD